VVRKDGDAKFRPDVSVTVSLNSEVVTTLTNKHGFCHVSVFNIILQNNMSSWIHIVRLVRLY
jgi:hypothetical protein